MRWGPRARRLTGRPRSPPGLLVQAPERAIVTAFAELCALQPVRMDADGLVCAPRAAPDLAAPALARCPLPTRPLTEVPGWPDPPAAMVAGWYRRGPGHLPAPAGVRELVQAPGEGFGPGGHATTAMCLAAIEGLAPGRAVDAGCGSGLLAQAWARLGRGPVIACDLDPRAVDQAARSLAAAGLGARRRPAPGPARGARRRGAGRGGADGQPARRCPPRRSFGASGRPRRAAVLSGLRPAEAGAVAGAYRALGLRPAGRARAAAASAAW